ncbi:hypothetical protein ABC347_17215 [Sphingomonas sp. 1P06PA]|uniref:hypothetical protein n=1 Tax=Sphingomonas sp. 1P06PA TaxID=554121 RepID=UPI0039A64B78
MSGGGGSGGGWVRGNRPGQPPAAPAQPATTPWRSAEPTAWSDAPPPVPPKPQTTPWQSAEPSAWSDPPPPVPPKPAWKPAVPNKPVLDALQRAQATLPANSVASPVQTCPYRLKEKVTPRISGVDRLKRRRADIPKSENGKITLKVERTWQNLGYTLDGTGTLTPAPGGCDLFTDPGFTNPVAGPLTYPVSKLLAGMDLYVRPADRDGASATFTLALSDARDDRIIVDAAVSHSVTIEDVGVVRPTIKTEYKVAMLDQALYTFQRPGEPKLEPDPTRIELGLDNHDPRYTGHGTFQPGGKSRLFLDPTCRTLATNLKFTADQLRAGVKLWARGLTQGVIDMTLTLSPSTDPMVEAGPPATETFGVARLAMKLSHYDDAATKPAKRPHDDAGLVQQVMTDADKVAGRRLLSVQRAAHASRAKVEVLKLEAGDWPAGSDAHMIVIDQFRRASGGGSRILKLFDAEKGGNEVALPLQIGVPALKAAPKTYWVEGASAGSDWSDCGLEVGMDRTDPPPIPKIPKHYGDFGRFTVIEVVSADLTPIAERLEDDGAAAGSKKYTMWTNLKKGGAGREVEVEAKIHPPLSGLKLYFRWVADAANRKTNNGVDLDEMWPRIDGSWTKAQAIKFDWFDTLTRGADKHRTAITNHGSAKCKLVTARYGGDKAKIGIYISQDPQQGQHEAGDALHAQEPPQFNTVEVRRKFWIQLIQAAGSPALSTAAATANFDAVRATMITKPQLDLSDADMRRIPNSRFVGYMINEGAGNGMQTMISNLNKDKFYTRYKPAALTLPVAIGDAQWDLNGRDERVTVVLANRLAGAFPITERTTHCLSSPAINGKPLFRSGSYELFKYDHAAAQWTLAKRGKVRESHVFVDPNRTSVFDVSVNDPTDTGSGSLITNQHYITITLNLQCAAGPYAGESQNQRIITIRQADRQFNDTIVHECGHAFRQVINPGNQLPQGPTHPNSQLGQGWHCFHHEAGELRNCVMDPVVQSDADGIHRFCEVCHGFMVIEEMSDVQ